MNECDIEKSMTTTFRLLDTIDIAEIVGGKEWEIFKLEDKLEELLKDEVKKYPELEGCLFDGVADCEFIEYLEKRYNKRFYQRGYQKLCLDCGVKKTKTVQQVNLQSYHIGLQTNLQNI